MKSTGNTILVTGGTSGLGLGLALRWQAAGNTVVVAGRRTELLDEIAAEHPGIGTLHLDVTDPASIATATADVLARYPDLDVLVTMAGIMLAEDVRDPASLAVAEDTVTTNLLGTIRMVSALLPHLLGREHAAILTVSSGLAFTPLAVTPTYNATKAAVHQYTEGLRLQLAGTSVQVHELVPPAVQTALMGQQDSPHAMPLAEYLDETMALLAADPDADEVLVDRVRFLRFAEVEGRYDAAVAAVNGIPL
jgi:uncharacterized oxidoreductase